MRLASRPQVGRGRPPTRAAHLVLGVGDEAQTDEQRKWESIKKEVVDHDQFFEDSEDEETGGFDCIAR